MEDNYQICTNCVMDTTDPLITFNSETGECNHCSEFALRKKDIPYFALNDPSVEYSKVIDKIKKRGKGRKYDCIVGISGGVDSSYVAMLAKNEGLRCLLVHLDNGWNSELAVKNVESIVKYTGFDLYTIVIDWREFRAMQKSFFKADVVDIELLSDHAIFATISKLARKYKIKYSLSGLNFATESILPASWNWRKTDSKNIKSICKRFGASSYKTFPFMGILKKVIYQYGGLAESVPILNYIDYDKDKAIRVLTSDIGWRSYGSKHHESVFTRFFQGYILPKKFNIDKRRAHYSSLINIGTLSREEAMSSLESEPYSVADQLSDKELVMKKLGFSESEFSHYMSRNRVCHSVYGTDEKLTNALRYAYRKILK